MLKSIWRTKWLKKGGLFLKRRTTDNSTKLPCNNIVFYFKNVARRAGSDGNMSASGSAGPGFDPRQSRKLIAIRPSDGYVKPSGPLGAFREEQAMSRHRVSPSPFLSSSSYTPQHSYTYTSSHPNLNFLRTLYRYSYHT